MIGYLYRWLSAGRARFYRRERARKAARYSYYPQVELLEELALPTTAFLSPVSNPIFVVPGGDVFSPIDLKLLVQVDPLSNGDEVIRADVFASPSAPGLIVSLAGITPDPIAPPQQPAFDVQFDVLALTPNALPQDVFLIPFINGQFISEGIAIVNVQPGIPQEDPGGDTTDRVDEEPGENESEEDDLPNGNEEDGGRDVVPGDNPQPSAPGGGADVNGDDSTVPVSVAPFTGAPQVAPSDSTITISSSLLLIDPAFTLVPNYVADETGNSPTPSPFRVNGTEDADVPIVEIPEVAIGDLCSPLGELDACGIDEPCEITVNLLLPAEADLLGSMPEVLVYQDKNANCCWDDGEPYAFTDATGECKLDLDTSAECSVRVLGGQAITCQPGEIYYVDPCASGYLKEQGDVRFDSPSCGWDALADHFLKIGDKADGPPEHLACPDAGLLLTEPNNPSPSK